MSASPLLAVDPGIRGSGAALFVGGSLVWCDYVKNPCRSGCGAAEAASMASWIVGACQGRNGMIAEVAVEWPRVYVRELRAGSKKDPNDLLALCGVTTAVAALLAPARATSYAPSDWKGQMDKAASHFRINARLTPRERDVMAKMEEAAGALAHNAWDAAGIGMHHLGRTARHRVIPT